MNKTIYFLLLSLVIFSCKTENSTDTETASSTDTVTDEIATDSDNNEGPLSDDNTENENSQVDIVAEMLEYEMNYIRSEWDGVQSPLIATFKYTDIGDYPHIVFATENKEYDFGQGDNNFGDYNLWEEGEDTMSEDETSPNQYTGKTFRITWSWRKSTFLCCEGIQSEVTAEVPSIDKLELMD